MNPNFPPGAGKSFAMNGPRTWVQWILFAVAVILGLVLAIFFFAMFIGLAIVFTLFVAGRMWWLKHSMRKAGQENIIEGEYRVDEAEDSKNPAAPLMRDRE